MKIIVGLGNPGEKFKNTRHNVGFMVVEKITQNHNLKFKTNKKFKAEILKLVQNDKEVLLVKPQTFMNASGSAVKRIIDFYKNKKILITNYLLTNYLYVIHDDLDIPLGEYKVQFGRSPAGHHGVESVIKELGTKDFWRVRIGIKNRVLEFKSLRVLGENFVLQKFSKDEKKIIDKVMKQIIERLTNDYL